MSNEKFKVKFGLAVGDTALTVDGTTGDTITDGYLQVSNNTTGEVTVGGGTAGRIEIGQYNRATSGTPYIDFHSSASTADYDVRIQASGGTSTSGQGTLTVYADGIVHNGDMTITGDLAVNGGDITTTALTGNLFNTNATTVRVGGAATTVSIGADTGTTTVNNALSADSITTSGDAAINGGDITTSAVNATVFNATATSLSMGGAATTVSIGADTGTTTVNNSLAADDITTTGDAAINGGDITTSAINATVFNATATTLNVGGAATTVTLGAATGTLTLNNATVVGNAANTTQNLYNTVATTMNFAGAATTTNIGTTTGSSIINGNNRFTSPAIFNFAGANNYRGLMISNGNGNSTANARTGLVLRSISGAASAPRGGLIFENSRGTDTTPTALQYGDFLGEIIAGGRSSTGWISDLVAAAPLGFTSYATENWVAATNCGTGWALQLQPTATTLTAGGASRITTIDSSPQNLTLRSDTMGLSKGKTIQFVATGCSTSGTTLTIGTVTSGSVTVGTMIQNSTGLIPAGTYIVSGSGSTWTLNQTPGTLSSLTIAGQQGYAAMTGAGNVDIMGNLTVRNSSIGQWYYTSTVTPAAANTAYAFPIGTSDTNITKVASVASTSRIIPGVAGKFNLQFSVQWSNANNSEQLLYIWLRKNGSDVAESAGKVTCLKSAANISSWNYMINSANTTDYWEIMYSVDDVAVTFPYIGAASPVPGIPSIITTLTPTGASS